MTKHWQLTEFSSLVGSHFTTINDWFKMLEERRIHYVTRAHNKRVYDELDLKIAKFIKSKREQKWNLDAIMNELQEDKENLRPFPDDFESTADNQQIINYEEIREQFANEVNKIINDQMENMLETLNKKLLLNTSEQNYQKTRQQQIENLITEHRVKQKLERAAIEEWSKQPEEEKMKRVGWFRKEEDLYKRDQFIRSYINKHYVEALQKHFDQHDQQQ